VEYETRWAQIARANLDLAGPGRAGAGQVIVGDARHLDWLLPSELAGQVSLIVTSPPYGPSTHGQVDTGPGVRISTATGGGRWIRRRRR
jgi:hypothetical protein